MKNKRIKLLAFTMVLILSSCNKNDKSIPTKINTSGTAAYDSSVTTENIEEYLFRDDSIYVDLRPYSWIAKDGHIAGFSFFPFYDFIAHNTYQDRLYTFKKITNLDGSYIVLGDVGSFTANYEESEQIIKRYFDIEKNIFVISQSGLEGCYFLNLLIQIGYDSSKLYNIGGYSISPGFGSVAYNNIENTKYKVQGNGTITYENTTFDAFKDLTPISK